MTGDILAVAQDKFLAAVAQGVGSSGDDITGYYNTFQDPGISLVVLKQLPLIRKMNFISHDESQTWYENLPWAQAEAAP